MLLAAERHPTIHDFGNFDPRLFEMRYDADGAPWLAERAKALLDGAGIAAQLSPEGGLDHGHWTALRYLYPDVDVPVVPLAFAPGQPPAQQFALGAALAPLADEGVLVFASGSITHNLRRVFSGGLRGRGDAEGEPPEIPESAAFREWMLSRSRARDWEALFAYRRLAPHAVDMHPTDEHLLPWYVAAGAGGRDAMPQRLHASVTHGCLGMDAYAFGPAAARLEGV